MNLSLLLTKHFTTVHDDLELVGNGECVVPEGSQRLIVR